MFNLRIDKFVKTPTLIAGVLAFSASFNVYSSSDGDLCKGINIVICAPIALIQSLQPTPPAQKISEAIAQGDLPRLKELLLRYPDLLTTAQLLEQALNNYTNESGIKVDSATSDKQLEIIKYLLDEPPKISQEKLSEQLVNLFRVGIRNRARLEMVANLLILHGASIIDLNLSDWSQTGNTSEELLMFAIANGADLNRTGKYNGNPPALSFLIFNKLRMAEMLLQHGADPNVPRNAPERSGLVYIARRCKQFINSHLTKERADHFRNVCEQQSVEQTALLIKYGADVNGLIHSEEHCITPYLAAQEMGNQILADRLLLLGANKNLCVTNPSKR